MEYLAKALSLHEIVMTDGALDRVSEYHGRDYLTMGSVALDDIQLFISVVSVDHEHRLR